MTQRTHRVEIKSPESVHDKSPVDAINVPNEERERLDTIRSQVRLCTKLVGISFHFFGLLRLLDTSPSSLWCK